MRRFSTLILALAALCIAGCTATSSITEEERAYLEKVKSVELPLRLALDRSEEAISRAIAWVNKYSLYQIRTQGPTHVETVMPTSRLQGGHGYRIDLKEFDGKLTVEISALQADIWESGEPVPDPFVERMAGLYIRDGIEPPNKRVGFEEGRR